MKNLTLFAKLANAKNKIGKISKDSSNPFYKSKYFDINKLIEVVEPILFENGLLLMQPIMDNKVYSIIYDVESNDKIESYLELPNLTDPQKIGSAISYYRRYSLQSLLALQAEDDDANLTIQKPINKEQKKNIEMCPEYKGWNDCKKAINDKTITLDLIKKNYILSEKNEKLLTQK